MTTKYLTTRLHANVCFSSDGAHELHSCIVYVYLCIQTTIVVYFVMRLLIIGYILYHGH